VEIKEVVDAKTRRFDEDAAWALLKTAGAVTVAKGKKIQRFVPETDGKEAVLQQAMGPSGNLRAPTFRVRDRFVIGFNDDLYEEWVK
jgi:hypothetical protein